MKELSYALRRLQFASEEGRRQAAGSTHKRYSEAWIIESAFAKGMKRLEEYARRHGGNGTGEFDLSAVLDHRAHPRREYFTSAIQDCFAAIAGVQVRREVRRNGVFEEVWFVVTWPVPDPVTEDPSH